MFKKMTIPLLLTWLRIFLVPIFIGIYYLPDTCLNMSNKNILATLIFMFAALTDYLDGYLARLLKQETSFGAFLDPVADKAIVASSLVMLVNMQRTFVFAAIIIIIREIAVSALREWMAQLGETKSVAVAYIGKLKTTLQMLAIAFLLLDYHGNFINTNYIGNFFYIVNICFI